MSRRPVLQRHNDLRRVLAQEAARIIAEEGVRDFLLAKRKAAARLEVRENARIFPTNLEIENALAEYHRLFRRESQPERLQQLREAAVRAMRLFADFSPRLTGPVLTGNATVHADVQLHLFTDVQEQVATFLLSCNIPYETTEHRFRLSSGDYRHYPAYRFVAGDVVIDTVIFPFDGMRAAPVNPVDGKPMRRAGIREVQALLEGGGVEVL